VGRVTAIGEQVRVQGWALAGVGVCVAEDADAARRAWHSLDEEVAVVILTAAAAAWLDEEATGCQWPLTVVMPS